jgi:hypothetical protein
MKSVSLHKLYTNRLRAGPTRWGWGGLTSPLYDFVVLRKERTGIRSGLRGRECRSHEDRKNTYLLLRHDLANPNLDLNYKDKLYFASLDRTKVGIFPL